MRVPIPALIRRNTLLLALSQAFTGAGMGLVYSIGPLMIIAVSGSAALSGLSVTLMGVSRFVIAYPVGRLTDARGRKPAMMVGLACALIGAVIVGLATIGAIFPLLIAGLLVFGMGMNAAQQLRVAAADMYPSSRRAEGLGYVLTGSLVGVVVSPSLVTLAQTVSGGLGVDPLGVPWLLLPLLILPGMLFVSWVRPDPKVIAQRLAEYYPGYAPPEPTSLTGQTGPRDSFSLSAFLSNDARRLAVFANLGAQGSMAIVMISSSLLLHQHGSTLPEIAASSALHSFGMWAFALPLGRLADRLGRRPVLLLGGATATAGAFIATQTNDYWTITAGAFLVGVGWCASNVATTVVIADTTVAAVRGRAVGFNDSMTAAANILVPLVAGPMGALFGIPSTGLLAVALMLGPLLMLLTLDEPEPGVYRQRVTSSVSPAVD
ncbi:MAG TPA: MFS transporter [Chloroflexota bacterium]|nr:MFS transporter [Chloroflexota bacterium]